MPPAQPTPRRLLVTAGPTHEPLDAVRFLGNRSSGRLGIALADEAAKRGWTTTLLLGPVQVHPTDSRVMVRRFRTAADLQALLAEEAPGASILIMAAAVADYRPASPLPEGKLRRESGPLALALEPTPDLLAQIGATRRQGQILVGFALEPRERLEASARDKLVRKNVDMIVANPLETMDSPDIEARLFLRGGTEQSPGGSLPKDAFASWLLDVLERCSGKDAR